LRQDEFARKLMKKPSDGKYDNNPGCASKVECNDVIWSLENVTFTITIISLLKNTIQ